MVSEITKTIGGFHTAWTNWIEKIRNDNVQMSKKDSKNSNPLCQRIENFDNDLTQIL